MRLPQIAFIIIDDFPTFMVSSVREEASHRLASVHVKKEKHISANDFRINRSIRAAEVRLIGPDGKNVGVVPTQKALEIAHDADLDLVEVSPNAKPPVCRVMDFGKFLYERAKKDREARKAQTKVEMKEIRLRPKTNEHHRGFKVKDARRWLENGIKVKVTIRFRGREMDYPEIALEDLREIAEELSDVGTIEQRPQMEGRTMLVILVPAKGGAIKKEKGKQPEGQKQAKVASEATK